jgi:hypothetical protein
MILLGIGLKDLAEMQSDANPCRPDRKVFFEKRLGLMALSGCYASIGSF